jgi:tRNA(Arg) A34 adenosine deaminase TadA
MFSQPLSLDIKLPTWIEKFSQTYIDTNDISKRMSFVISASRRNVVEKTGGPFAAAIFEMESGKLVSLGVNLVTTQGLSILHAEIVAISIAQRKLGVYDLGGTNMQQHELVTSTEPCAMCFGAIPWSGVKRVITAAQDGDARSIGFDEGPKLQDWESALIEREIAVITSINRDEAYSVLKFYRDISGHIYNSRETATGIHTDAKLF